MGTTDWAVLVEQLISLVGDIFGVESGVGRGILTVVLALVAILGTATTIVAGLRKIARVTPTDKDDVYLSKLERFLMKIRPVLSRVAYKQKRNSSNSSKLK